ncbi:MAG: hypothetical protein GY798_35060 [Hyphomicrobiales bacterium]|nr:hypothetical protein [Hyphomicrobiales bacterium]
MSPEDFVKCGTGPQFFPDRRFSRHFLNRAVDNLRHDGLGNKDDPIHVGKDQIAGVDPDTGRETVRLWWNERLGDSGVNNIATAISNVLEAYRR